MSTALLCFLLFAVACHAACPSVTIGTKWSSNAAWNKADVAVSIPAGQTVYLDVAPSVVLGVISIYGTLYFSNNNMELQTQGIIVHSGGSLVVGTPACPITAKVIVTLFGKRDGASTLGTDPYLNSTYGAVAFGHKGIAVANGGSIQMNGYTTGPLWTNLAATVQSGGRVIQMMNAVDWTAGNNIVIASTDFSEVLDAKNKNYTTMNGIPFPEQSETAVIASVSNDKKTITLVDPLKYVHWGAGYMRAEVGLLDRRIIVRGDAGSDAELFGGHLMMRYGPVLQIAGVEFTRMGQQGVMGRYPIHFHVAMDVSKVNASVVGCSIHHNYQRCISIHETSGTLVKNNVAYLTYGHCYFLEDGSEMDNMFDSNLGIYTKPMFPPLIPSDTVPSVFWISNPRNSFINNSASSTFVGFWVIPPEKPVDKVGVAIWGKVDSMKPLAFDLTIFDNNVAHSCYLDGFQAQQGQSDQQMLTPVVGWRGKGGVNAVTKFIAYKCRRSALWHLFMPNPLIDHCVFIDGGEQLVFVTSGLRNSILIGESDNIGLVTNPVYGRSMPRADGVFSWSCGYRTYDNGGTSVLADVTFYNFTYRPSRPMGALAPSTTGQFGTYPDNICWNCKFINSLPMISPSNTSLYLYNTIANGMSFPDASGGYISGGGYLNGNQTYWSTLPGAKALPEVNGYTVPAFHGRLAAMHVFPNPYGVSSTNPIAANDTNIYKEAYGTAWSARYRPLGSSSDSPNIFSVGKSPTPTLGYWSALLTNRDGRRIASGPYLDISIIDHKRGDWNVLALPLPMGTKYNVSYGSITIGKANTWEELSPYKTWYNATNEHLYVLMNVDPYDYYTSPFSPIKNKTEADYDTWMQSSAYYQIRSDCGASCGFGSKYTVPSMPVSIPYVLRYDRYKAILQGVSTKEAQAQIFAQLYPKNALGYPAIGFQIWHGLRGNAKTLYTSFEDSITGAKLADNVNGQSSYVSLMLISRDFWAAMVNGTLKVSIRSMWDNSYILSGTFGLQETQGCYRPPSSTTKCGTPSYSTYNVFSGLFNSANYVVQKPVVMNVTGLCGGPVITMNADTVLYFNKTSSNFITVPDKYTHLEFSIRAQLPWNNYNFLNMTISSKTPNGNKNVALDQNSIFDYIINSNGWSFVRVSLASLGGQKISSIQFIFPHWSVNTPVHVDQLRFSSNGSPVPAFVTNRSPCTRVGNANVGQTEAVLTAGAAAVVPLVLFAFVAAMLA